MFIILAGVEAGLSRSSTSCAVSWVSLSFIVRGRGRSLALREGRTLTTRGWSTAGVVSFSALGSLAQLALARLLVPLPPSGGVWLSSRCAGSRRAHRGTSQDVTRC